MTTNLTSDKISRIKQAIAECNKFIAIECGRNPNLRPASIQKTLDFYISHREKLAKMIAA